MSTSTSDRFRTFGDTFGKGAPAFLHVADTGVVFTNGDGQVTTGAWRAATPADLGTTSNVSISGLSLSVGAVAITGNPLMTVSNPVLPISGNVFVQNALPINISGWVKTIFTGSVAASFDSTSIVNAQTTGNDRLLVADQLLSGISGRLSNTLNVAITNGVVPISGVVQASVSSGPIVDAIVSGNNLIVTSNVLLSGISGNLAGNLSDVASVKDITGQLYLAAISGLLASNLTDPAHITGSVSISNTAPINVSGTVIVSGLVSSSISNPIGVTGVKADLNSSIFGSPTVPYSLVPMGGRAVAVTGAGSITGGYNTGDYVMFAFNKDNGGLLVNQGALDYTQDTVTVSGFATGAIVTVVNKSSSVATTYAPSGTAPYTGTNTFFGQALAANPNRLEMFVQNTHTGIPLLVNLGTGVAGPNSFSMILNPSTVQSWGGSSFGSSRYKGAVQVSGGAWVAWEI